MSTPRRPDAGDFILMAANTLDYLATFRQWVKASPAVLTIAGGMKAD
jgi:hypothetical protein